MRPSRTLPLLFVAKALLASSSLSCDDPEFAAAELRSSALSSADTDAPPDVEDTTLSAPSEVVTPEPNPNNIEGPEELRAAYERMLAESPEFRAAVQNTRPYDPSQPMRALEPVPPPPVPEYCGNDPGHGHPMPTPPAPSARPGARDVIPHRYHSDVEPARRGLHRPEADREKPEDLEALIGVDFRWRPEGADRAVGQPDSASPSAGDRNDAVPADP